jgi:hypothetical protein
MPTIGQSGNRGAGRQRRHGRGVAGHHQGLGALLAEKTGHDAATLADEFRGFLAVGNVPAIGDVQQRLIGQQTLDLGQHRQPPTPESNTPSALHACAPTDAATRIALDPQLTKARAQGIDQQQAPHQRLAETRQQLQRFQGLQAADQAHQRTDHPASLQVSSASLPCPYKQW